MNDYFMQRQEAQPDTSLFEMRLRAERAEKERDSARRDYEVMNAFREHAEKERDQLRKEVEDLQDRMAMLREEVRRRDDQVRHHAGELRELRRGT